MKNRRPTLACPGKGPASGLRIRVVEERRLELTEQLEPQVIGLHAEDTGMATQGRVIARGVREQGREIDDDDAGDLAAASGGG